MGSQRVGGYCKAGSAIPKFCHQQKNLCGSTFLLTYLHCRPLLGTVSILNQKPRKRQAILSPLRWRDLSRFLIESENNLGWKGLQAVFFPLFKAEPPLIVDQAAHVQINFKPNGLSLFSNHCYIFGCEIYKTCMSQTILCCSGDALLT